MGKDKTPITTPLSGYRTACRYFFSPCSALAYSSLSHTTNCLAPCDSSRSITEFFQRAPPSPTLRFPTPAEPSSVTKRPVPASPSTFRIPSPPPYIPTPTAQIPPLPSKHTPLQPTRVHNTTPIPVIKKPAKHVPTGNTDPSMPTPDTTVRIATPTSVKDRSKHPSKQGRSGNAEAKTRSLSVPKLSLSSTPSSRVSSTPQPEQSWADKTNKPAAKMSANNGDVLMMKHNRPSLLSTSPPIAPSIPTNAVKRAAAAEPEPVPARSPAKPAKLARLIGPHDLLDDDDERLNGNLVIIPETIEDDDDDDMLENAARLLLSSNKKMEGIMIEEDEQEPVVTILDEMMDDSLPSPTTDLAVVPPLRASRNQAPTYTFSLDPLDGLDVQGKVAPGAKGSVGAVPSKAATGSKFSIPSLLAEKKKRIKKGYDSVTLDELFDNLDDYDLNAFDRDDNHDLPELDLGDVSARVLSAEKSEQLREVSWSFGIGWRVGTCERTGVEVDAHSFCVLLSRCVV
ncbi:hypothetical protein BC938DRAFT_474063 [Jimgerdemannia flammicorona]|uniref:Uncharacterized protein n=1 Tax=Jimgerdemannia flammicorona TaxID=994334 RepID=A0A433Q2W3_9FUNG|nr:hypothetical protein BC938DRAFT_474063 [Jimgerdemannia flammicorona]